MWIGYCFELIVSCPPATLCVALRVGELKGISVPLTTGFITSTRRPVMTDRKNWFADLTLITPDVAALLEKGGIDSIEKLLASEPEMVATIVGSADVASEILDEAAALQATPTIQVELPEVFPWYLPIDAITYEIADQLEAAGIDSIEKIVELAGSNDLAQILDDDDLAAAIHEQAADAQFFVEDGEIVDDDDDDPIIEVDPNEAASWVAPVIAIAAVAIVLGFGWLAIIG